MATTRKGKGSRDKPNQEENQENPTHTQCGTRSFAPPPLPEKTVFFGGGGHVQPRHNHSINEKNTALNNQRFNENV